MKIDQESLYAAALKKASVKGGGWGGGGGAGGGVDMVGCWALRVWPGLGSELMEERMRVVKEEVGKQAAGAAAAARADEVEEQRCDQ